MDGKHNPGTLKRSRSLSDNRKRKRHSPGRDPSYATPKPVETIYRILCPVGKIGSVLGKGGEIVNALRDETHAKIRVADAIRGAEERVILIYNYSSKEPGRSDATEDPERSNFIHCPAQDALLKVHDRIVADEYLRGGVVHEKTELDDDVTVRILVPNNQVGCLLGKGGTIIQKLRSETGASIRVLPADRLPPCAMDTDILIQISGMPDVVKGALYEVSTLLHQHPRKENPPLEELVAASTQGLYRSDPPISPMPRRDPVRSHLHSGVHAVPPMPWFSGHRNGSSGYEHSGFGGSHIENIGEMAEFSMKILCPSGKIGGIIGKGGITVKQLEKQTGAKIKVEDTAPEDEERIVIVTSNEAPWAPISPTIEAVLQLQGRTNSDPENGSITTRLLVPSSHVGSILGQGGHIITEMRRRTGADIRVYSKNDKPKYASDKEELIQISGNQAVATEALLEIVSRLRTRTLRPGNASVNSTPFDPFDRFASSGNMLGRRLPSYDKIGAANTFGYEHPKGARPRTETHAYPGPRAPFGHNAGSRHEAPGYHGAPSTAAYGAGSRQYDAQAYSRPPSAIGYGAGRRHEVEGYPGPQTTRVYGSGTGHDAPGYPGPPAATGYNAGAGYEAPVYPGPPAGTMYGTGSRYDAHAYSGPPTTAEYDAGTQGYPGQPFATGYGAGSGYEARGYPAPPNAAGFPNSNSSIEAKNPSVVVSSDLGTGWSNISNDQQVSGSRYDPFEMHESSEQMKAAEGSHHSFGPSGEHNASSVPRSMPQQVLPYQY